MLCRTWGQGTFKKRGAKKSRKGVSSCLFFRNWYRKKYVAKPLSRHNVPPHFFVLGLTSVPRSLFSFALSICAESLASVAFVKRFPASPFHSPRFWEDRNTRRRMVLVEMSKSPIARTLLPMFHSTPRLSTESKIFSAGSGAIFTLLNTQEGIFGPPPVRKSLQGQQRRSPGSQGTRHRT